MYKKMFNLLAALICLTLLVTGCTAGQSTSKETSTGASNLKSIDLMANVQAIPWSGTPDIADQNLLSGISRFSAQLLLESVKNEGNIMISPASVFLALAMTVNGADTETRDAMLQVLAGQDITIDQINQLSRDWMALLEKSESKTQMSLANSIWFRDGFVPYQPFLQSNADYYKAGARNLDFSDPGAPAIINGWVKEATHDLIDKLIEKIEPSTVMFLINTLYFKADWMTPFIKNDTWKQKFATPAGSVEVDFMHRTDHMRYFADLDAKGVALPYDNEQFVYFAILPDDDVDPHTWLAQQEAASLFDRLGTMVAQDAQTAVALALPRYEVKYDDSLVNELTTLGMGIAFNGGLADFSRLNEARSKGLYISEVKHKTAIRVDEKGTEAAAATVVVIDKSAKAYDEELVFDRPFLYGIMDMETKLPLFVGILEDPTGK
ncbi:MAG: serpin family protein [Bacillota bacterium]|nr:serpin family protein [Bacillota bacterium]